MLCCRFLGTDIFWGRGNGWASGALVAAIEYGQGDSHRAQYVDVFQRHIDKLVSLVGVDGAWRPSLLHPTVYPRGETTSTANFVSALAFGLRENLVPPDPKYEAAVRKGWDWLATTALQANGTVGWCQPGGGSPENNYDAGSTSDFCVGDFLLAAAEVVRLGI